MTASMLAVAMLVLAVRNAIRIWTAGALPFSWTLFASTMAGIALCLSFVAIPPASGPLARTVALVFWAPPGCFLLVVAARGLRRRFVGRGEKQATAV